MDYIKVSLRSEDTAVREILLALLAAYGYEGFEETEEALSAYIAQDLFDAQAVAELAAAHSVPFETEVIVAQNWNAQWESGFAPVIVPGFCTVRAGFHDIAVDTPYEVVITPKMSFGTGHHATTYLMIERMEAMELSGKRVLDFGTGTGILAILAALRGAPDVLALDNDEHACVNARENTEVNNCPGIRVAAGSLEAAAGAQFDVILANINRNILLQYMKDMHGLLQPGGMLLMSGLLEEDRDVIVDAALNEGFVFREGVARGGWIALLFNS